MNTQPEMTEVLVTIAPFSGADETPVRVTIRRHQLRDVLEKEDYGHAVFDALRDVMCAALKYDAETCVMEVFLPEDPDSYSPLGRNSRPEVEMDTEDVVDGLLLLH